MRRLLNSFLQSLCTAPRDPRAMDPMAMTLHDVVRLVDQERREAKLQTAPIPRAQRVLPKSQILNVAKGGVLSPLRHLAPKETA
ncbi:hypothetical protein [Rosistilla oblonga]|uniref:Uncharacterized protein n=1 Tax=Rosistilla oblonga TaxID=2527990 RepID=A0A518IZT7_9BACT|nr:hypothetical protein [Rosistilla oblonga]QDV58601.1 hypothetical protein Mal33_46250 [Rosistilla oblonga]